MHLQEPGTQKSLTVSTIAHHMDTYLQILDSVSELKTAVSQTLL